MRKLKGSALIWCLVVLIVLSILSLTAVAFAMSYYKSCIKNAGANQVDYNSRAALELVKDQLTSEFGGQQIYFRYSSSASGFTDYTKTRTMSIETSDKEFFSGLRDEFIKGEGSSETTAAFLAVRRLENLLITEYYHKKTDPSYVEKAKNLRLFYNYDRIDSSYFGPGYYGDFVDVYIDDIKEIADDNGTHYIVLLKSKSNSTSGVSDTSGALFDLSSFSTAGGSIPAFSCRLLDIGVSKELDEFKTDEMLNPMPKYPNAGGVIVSAGTDEDKWQRGFIYGDSVERYSNTTSGIKRVLRIGESYAELEKDREVVRRICEQIDEFKKLGFIKTDGQLDESGILKDQLSHLDPDLGEYRVGTSDVKGLDGNNDLSDNNNYYELQSNLQYTDAFLESHENMPAYLSANIINDPYPNQEPISKVKAAFAIPTQITGGNASNNLVRRYYIASNADDFTPEKFYNNKTSSEFNVSFNDYIRFYRTGTNAAEADPKLATTTQIADTADYYNNGKIVYGIIERKYRENINGADKNTVHYDETIKLENIKLENGMTYFFRVRQNAEISFDESCYDPDFKATVYFQLSDDDGANFRPELTGNPTHKYSVDLKLIDPPSNVTFYAFDYRDGGTGGAYNQTLFPQSAPELKAYDSYKDSADKTQYYKGIWIDATRNITIVVNDKTREHCTDGELTLNGWFRAYKINIIDESGEVKDEFDIIDPEKPEMLKVHFNYVEDTRCVTFQDTNVTSNNRQYRWNFIRYVDGIYDLDSYKEGR